MSDALPLPRDPQIGLYRRLAHQLHQIVGSGDLATLDDGKTLLARWHGFPSWTAFTTLVAALRDPNNPAAQFEHAADAIVTGDLDRLRGLLHQNSALVHQRSIRLHRSTLLHYISANGIEDFRQSTPPNIVEIATLLLDAGSDLHAESEAYGGGSTALNLTATSCHPQDAGVQIPLLTLLLDYGAQIGAADVVSCLRNGRGEAAEFLASRGAPLDLEGAAGTGRLDMVRELLPTATPEQRHDAFAWACEFGRTDVVDYLLRQGAARVGDKLPHHGQTGLHWAAWEGHAETVRLLLDHGAAIDAIDGVFEGTPLDWALYHWANCVRPLGDHYATVALLTAAGAKLEPKWFDLEDEERQSTVRKIRSDPRMAQALGKA